VACDRVTLVEATDLGTGNSASGEAPDVPPALPAEKTPQRKRRWPWQRKPAQ